MSHNPITLDLLRTLAAIDQHGSFAAAAEALHKVPSALTYTLQKLEQELQITLFDRTGHKAKMTPAGKYLLKNGRDVLRSMDQLAINSQKIATGWEPEFTLVYDTVFDSDWLIPILKEFQEVAPFVSLKVHEETLGGTWEALISGKADLIIAPTLAKPKHLKFESTKLCELKMVLAVAADHPLTQLKTQQEIDQAMADYPAIIVRDSAESYERFSTGLSYLENRIEVPSMREKIQAQVAGLGVGLLPEMRIRDLITEGRLMILEQSSANEIESEVQLAWREDSSGKALGWIKDKLKSTF